MFRGKITKFLVYGIFILATICLSTAATAVAAEVVPVIDIEEDTDRFEPTTYHDWDYYIIPPGTKESNVMYEGEASTATAHYTDGSGNVMYDSSVAVNDVSPVSSSLLQDDKRYGNHPLFDPEVYPRAVAMQTEKESELVKKQKLPISLHMDYSFTFLAESGISYLGLVDSADPFILDVYVRDIDPEWDITFGSASQNSYYFSGITRQSLPVFPTGGTVQNFTLTLHYSNSLVTITPHPLKLPKILANIEVNTSYSGNIEQGAIYEQDGSKINFGNANLFSMRRLNMSLNEGEYYRIYVNIESSGFFGVTGMTLPWLHYSPDSLTMTGSLNENGALIKANEDTVISLVLYTMGPTDQTYTVYFRNVSPTTGEKALTLNVNTELKEDIYYSFTLASPSMIAVNQTGDYEFDLFVEGMTPGTWDDATGLYSSWNDWFSIVDGPLFGGSAGDIVTDWYYLPAGTYAVRIISRNPGDEIRFTVLPIQSPSTFNVNQDSIIAVELPVTKNRYNLYNVSTADHINQSIWYEFAIVDKYNEGYVSYTDDVEIGNFETSPGIWEGWPAYNGTPIYGLIPTRPYEVPIMIIRPFAGYNESYDQVDTFAGQLTVSHKVPSDYYPSISMSYIGSGAFLPMSPITGTTTYPVNMDLSDDNDQVYAIPMNLDVNSLYNITVTSFGNESSVLNATIQNIYAHGGNLQRIMAFYYIWDTNPYDSYYYRKTTGLTNSSATFLILTVSSTSYLFIDLQRTGSIPYRNATLQVSITKIPVNELAFSVPKLSDYDYNTTVNGKEVKNTEFLVTSAKPPAAPGFELAVALVTLVVMTAVVARKRRK
ncbi:MAG: hypothetical protein ACFFD4_21795 [Candidatus Odinarchaeota archaeon]